MQTPALQYSLLNIQTKRFRIPYFVVIVVGSVWNGNTERFYKVTSIHKRFFTMPLVLTTLEMDSLQLVHLRNDVGCCFIHDNFKVKLVKYTSSIMIVSNGRRKHYAFCINLFKLNSSWNNLTRDKSNFSVHSNYCVSQPSQIQEQKLK